MLSARLLGPANSPKPVGKRIEVLQIQCHDEIDIPGEPPMSTKQRSAAAPMIATSAEKVSAT